ncbi:hypothetical protein DVH24_039235 [Malus domestica]|uniref:Uncharacterized protein n=1 Tax=Malus domestica TaxID=3750 RepID=A0A498HVS2_MALDO|nr:hypothetical protein DVH24_039235 [Malus domestica]
MRRHVAFWELTDFGFHRNSEIKRVRARAFPGWVIHWKRDAFWEFTNFGFYRNSQVKRVHARAFPGWVTHWEVLV